MDNYPPPPPPHAKPPQSPLDRGSYDVFIIPPHASGSGFFYLPATWCSWPAFVAGFATALILVQVWTSMAPAIRTWWFGLSGTGGSGMLVIVISVGLGAWAFGRAYPEGGPRPGGGGAHPGAGDNGNGYTSGTTPGGFSNGSAPGAGARPSGNGYANGSADPQPGHHGPPPGHQHSRQAGPAPGAESAENTPKSSWQRPPPAASSANTNSNTNPPNNSAKGAWEKAREETKRREEDRKVKEAAEKKKADLEKRLKDMREKDTREREAREKEIRDKLEKEVREKLTKEKEEKDAREARLKEARLRAEARKAASDKAAIEKDDGSKPKRSTYAYSAMGEKTNPWPRGQPASPAARSQPSSPTKKPPVPTAKTYLGTDEDAYSYRPYDKPKNPMHKKSHSSLYSESSYAASHSTSRTTPPPSNRGPYSTKDPDKIVIKAVYAFNNTFLKTPTSQLVSGVGSVTDGLILRITTEGLFIDDDVRGVPQREWDVKAWTMKLVEVWCPSFRQGPAGQKPSLSAARVATSGSPFKHRRLWGLDKDKPATSEETDLLLVEMAQLCRDNCLRSRASSSAAASSSTPSSAYSASSAASSSLDDRSETSAASSYASSAASLDHRRTRRTDAHQTGEHKTSRLHVLRTSIRDQEGKKWLFVIPEEESWKVAVGLQRLRKSAQVRALGVSGMSASDARTTLENLGWA